MPSLPLPDAEHLEDFIMVVGSTPGSNVCLNTEGPCIQNAHAFSWEIIFQ